MAATKYYATTGLFTGAVVWGAIWYPYRVLEWSGVSGELASFLTYAIALGLGMVLYFHPRRRRQRLAPMLLWVGLTAGWANLAYVLAVIHGDVMRVMLLFYLAPLWTVIFSWWFLNERLQVVGYGVIALSLAGAMVMLWPTASGAPLLQNNAEWLGLSAGVAFSLSNVLARRMAYSGIIAKSVSIFLGVVFVSAIPLVVHRGALAVLPRLDTTTWLLLVGVGITVFAVTLVVQFGINHTPANRAIVIFLFELVVAAASAYGLAGEQITVREWLGGIMIVAASILSSRLDALPASG